MTINVSQEQNNNQSQGDNQSKKAKIEIGTIGKIAGIAAGTVGAAVGVYQAGIMDSVLPDSYKKNPVEQVQPADENNLPQPTESEQ